VPETLLSEPALAALFAVFIWWFSTGIVLLLDRLPHGALRWGHWASSLLALTAFAALAHTARELTVANAYCAFTCALLVWGWHELSFLSGWVTGPRRTALPPGTTGWPRFVESVRAILWHELAIVAVGAAIVAATWGEPNQVGTQTFLVLWVMRTSAKLNLYFGVRNLSEEFLPPHLAYLQSFFRRRAMNALLPFSVLGAGAVLALMVMHAANPGAAPAAVVGAALVGTMLAMAILEHLLLVLPIPSTALWRWALRGDAAAVPAAPTARAARNAADTHGAPRAAAAVSAPPGSP
jgi:putative photosynthetic complex assembly protein 2